MSGARSRTGNLRILAAALLCGSASAIADSAQAVVVISAAATANMSCVKDNCQPTKTNAVLNVTQLQNMLASGNVKVTTGSAKLAPLVKDIDVRAGLTWTSANGLTLDAYHSIVAQSPISVAGTGPLTLKYNDGDTSGDLSFHAKGKVTFFGTTNALTINGKAYKLFNSIPALAKAITKNPSGLFALSKQYDFKTTHTGSPIPGELFGTVEGLGNAVRFMGITGPANTSLGLFAEVGNSGVVRDIGLVNAQVQGSGGSSDGSLIAYNAGTIDNAWSTNATIYDIGALNVGGLVGLNSGTIENSWASGCGATANNTAGGLVGENDGNIFNSYVADGYAFANIAAAGGLVGFNDGLIETGWSTATATGPIAGGLVGSNAGGTVEIAYARGQVSGESSGSTVGAGGLVGVYNGGFINVAYSTGMVTGAAGEYVGGLIGNVERADTPTTTYWDLDTSGVSNPSLGAGNTTNESGITGLSTSQFQSGLPGGFSSAVWAQNATLNGGYPYLTSVPPK